MASRLDRLLDLLERVVASLEREADASVRQAEALERIAIGGEPTTTATPAKLSKPRRTKGAAEAARRAAELLGDGTVDELARARARHGLRRTRLR